MDPDVRELMYRCRCIGALRPLTPTLDGREGGCVSISTFGINGSGLDGRKGGAPRLAPVEFRRIAHRGGGPNDDGRGRDAHLLQLLAYILRGGEEDPLTQGRCPRFLGRCTEDSSSRWRGTTRSLQRTVATHRPGARQRGHGRSQAERCSPEQRIWGSRGTRGRRPPTRRCSDLYRPASTLGQRGESE